MKESVVIVGGGIAGLSLALQAAENFDVTVLETEFQPGYHSTGRSAAVLHIPFENDLVHRLTLDSVNFFHTPRRGFDNVATPLSTLRIGRSADETKVAEFLETWIGRCPWLEQVSQYQLRASCPILSSDFSTGVIDQKSLHLDVHYLLTRTRQAFNELGGKVETSFRVSAIESIGGTWQLTSDNGTTVCADVIVNAAGAWLDDIAQLAGIRPIGVQPKRRTAIRCRPDTFKSSWPMCYQVTHDLYFKPEGQSLMLSPCDATPSKPCDAQPEMIDIAMAIARLEESTTLDNVVPDESWAGLRVFVSDECPVIGFDRDHPGFFWYGAFGGFGVQTAPACSKLGAQLLRHDSFTNTAVSEQELNPKRIHSASSNSKYLC